MRRATALRLLGGFAAASLAGCADPDCAISLPPAPNAPSTRFGCEIYPEDDTARAVALLAGCGASLIRVQPTPHIEFTDAIFAAAAQHGMRVLIVTRSAAQPVDVAAYAAAQAALQERYAPYDPIWEIWNEPDLQQYWGAYPSAAAYATVAIETAKALRTGGAHAIWSGGTSGVDLEWIQQLKMHGVFDVLNGCAVHSYTDPCLAYERYRVALQMLPSGIALHTTETCVPSTQDQSSFLRGMWSIHRNLGLPTMIWCELRDGSAGKDDGYQLPYGLVTAQYQPKAAYATAQQVVGMG